MILENKGMSYTINYLQRLVDEAKVRKGMIVGLPKLKVDVSTIERLIIEYDYLEQQLFERNKLLSDLYDDILLRSEPVTDNHDNHRMRIVPVCSFVWEQLLKTIEENSNK